MKVKIIIIVIFIIFTFTSTYGQEKIGKTYKFVNPTAVNNLSMYIKSVSTADMNNYRFLNKSSIIIFKSGLKMELFSAYNLINLGIKIDTSRLLIKGIDNNPYFVFDISDDGKYVKQLFTKTKIK
mgnify:CR=1 FL=1|jgi:hypothetical protein